TVKSLAPFELEQIGAQIVLANTYHLFLRPGADIVQRAGGLHSFMGWERGLLTDSGGFQVFSLEGMRKVTDGGVEFQSHIDGSRHFISPEKAITVQHQLGADIIMAFDECCPGNATFEQAKGAMERTHAWAARCLEQHKGHEETQALFGIIQGGVYSQLRRESAAYISSMGFPGVAVGGLSVGEPKPAMYEMLDTIRPLLPPGKPHYLMGVGSPDCLVQGAMRGIDMFDCVLPTRTARMGTLLTFQGKLNIRNARYKEDFSPIDDGCACPCCTQFTRAYLAHLFRAGEILGTRLATLHNLHFILRLMERVREAIAEDRLEDFAKANEKVYNKVT
ncbi:MAG: tRNA guanosine(34) transglycosylase Tgt, partial [Clostridia bacterium]|nr:tRNA guanosine(34) transglycosylase Tgt [Clostridia bacterium]